MFVVISFLLGIGIGISLGIYAFIGFLRSRQKTYLWIFVFGGMFSLFTGIYLAYWVFKKTYQKAQSVTVFKQRTGIEMYKALLGAPVCELQVLNQKDQMLPRIDCCIWLEFSTCSAEIKRVISLQPYCL